MTLISEKIDMTIYDRSITMRTILQDLIFNEKNIETALGLAWLLGDYCRLNFDGFRGNAEVVVHLANEFENTLPYKILPTNSIFKDYSIIHVLTYGYDHGGHSQLLLNLVNGLSSLGCSQKIICTQGIQTGFKLKIKKYGVDIFECSGSGVEKINQIVSQCSFNSSIVLHIHPNDIFAAVSAEVLNKMNKRVLFVDHADHSFSFGRSSCSIVLSVSAFGWKITEADKTVHSHSFLGIPIEVREKNCNRKNNISLNKIDGKFTLLTVGRASKYRPIEGVSFVDFINATLSYDEYIEIAIVGSDGAEEWWADINPAFRSRVKFYGLVDSGVIASFYEIADIYVDSFPVSGATAAMEAFCHGCKVVGLRTYVGGYNPIESLYDKDLESLLIRVKKSLINKKFTKNNTNLLKKVDSFFSNKATARRLIDAINEKYHSLPKILKTDGFTYLSYESPWLRENTVRWPTRTFINISWRLKFQIIINYLFINYKNLSTYQIILCILWAVRFQKYSN